MTARLAVGVAAAGAVVTAAVCIALGKPLLDALALTGIGSGAAATVGLLGALVLYLARRSALGVQVSVVVLSAVGAVGLGVLAAAQAMFVSMQDLKALLVVTVSAGVVGVLVALMLGGRVATSSQALTEFARRIGDGGGPRPAGDLATSELARLSAELDETANRLRQARDRQEALEASRRELVSWVSHDLRTPLAGIRAMAEALEDGVVDDAGTVRRYHATLREEADRLSSLVDDLFELSRIHAGALELTLEPTPLADVVSDALAAAMPVAESKNVRLQGRIVGDPPEVAVSVPAFGRVLRNLLSNAIRETPEDGAVWVEAAAEDGFAVVRVADTCGGIPAQDLPRVFEPSFRGAPARTPGEGAGAGLGLAIAAGLVAAHDGDLQVENVGSGCCFTVRLPTREAGVRTRAAGHHGDSAARSDAVEGHGETGARSDAAANSFMPPAKST